VAAQLASRYGVGWLIGLIAALAVIEAVSGLASAGLRLEPYAERIGGSWRPGGTFEYPPALAVAAVCALVLTLGLTAGGALPRSTAAIVATLLAITVLATADRAGAVLAVLAAGWMALRLPAARRPAAIAGGAAAVAAGAVLVVAQPGGDLSAHLRHDPFGHRERLYRTGLRVADDRPLVGYGPGSYARASGMTATEAHNAVLQVAVEYGLPAAAGLAVAVVAIVLAALRRLRSRRPAELAWACSALVLATSSVYDFTWSFPPLVLLALAAGAGVIRGRGGG
jgi:O-antigen ligase